MLLVFDNGASIDQVRPLLPGVPSCIVIVTSRDALTGLAARHGARRLLAGLAGELADEQGRLDLLGSGRMLLW